MAEATDKLRILASNPDALGDMVLRQPMYARLAAAGHELVLLVRRSVLGAVPTLVPGARCIAIPGDPYQLQIQEGESGAWCDELVAIARDMRPDLLLVTSFQWTLLEERLAGELDVPVTAMNGHVFRGEQEWGQPATSNLRVDKTVDVDEDSSELEKYRRLCAAVLDLEPADLELPAPAVTANAAQQAAARALLEQQGLEAGEFVVAMVGDHEYSAVRNWRAEDWGTVLAHWARQHGRRFLFLGLESERETAMQVCAAMGDQATAAVLLMGEATSLDTVIGLLDSARAYIGRDTGPMHLATALGKPAIAIFGGGHWPRFLPAGNAHVLTVRLPCFKCDWKCPFKEAHCIRQVPVPEVTAAIGRLEQGQMQPAVQMLEPPAGFYEQMILELQREIEQRTRAMGDLDRDYARQHAALQHEKHLNQERMRELNEVQRQALEAQARVVQTQQQTVDALARVDELNRELQKRLTTRIANYLRALRQSKPASSREHGAG